MHMARNPISKVHTLEFNETFDIRCVHCSIETIERERVRGKKTKETSTLFCVDFHDIHVTHVKRYQYYAFDSTSKSASNDLSCFQLTYPWQVLLSDSRRQSWTFAFRSMIMYFISVDLIEQAIDGYKCTVTFDSVLFVWWSVGLKILIDLLSSYQSMHWSIMASYFFLIRLIHDWLMIYLICLRIAHYQLTMFSFHIIEKYLEDHRQYYTTIFYSL
jgi:hypothetical protein